MEYLLLGQRDMVLVGAEQVWMRMTGFWKGRWCRGWKAPLDGKSESRRRCIGLGLCGLSPGRPSLWGQPFISLLRYLKADLYTEHPYPAAVETHRLGDKNPHFKAEQMQINSAR